MKSEKQIRALKDRYEKEYSLLFQNSSNFNSSFKQTYDKITLLKWVLDEK
jgi:hypothetical protein